VPSEPSTHPFNGNRRLTAPAVAQMRPTLWRLSFFSTRAIIGA